MKKALLLLVGIYAVSFVAVLQAEEAKQKEDKPPVARKEETPKPDASDKEKSSPNPVVKIVTNKGEIIVELDAKKAPISVANFLAYTKDGFYRGTIFHRVIKNFMIQGGGMTLDMKKKKTKPPIKNEAANGLKNKRGTIAMARTSVPNSATSQFFINHKDNAFLDYRDPSPRGIGYAVFGKVIKGMEVVDKIAVTPTRKPGDIPIEPVVIEAVTLVEKEKPKEPEKQAPKEDKKADAAEKDKKE